MKKCSYSRKFLLIVSLLTIWLIDLKFHLEIDTVKPEKQLPSIAIVITVTEGYWAFFINFFFHFSHLEIAEKYHFIIFAEDRGAVELCYIWLNTNVTSSSKEKFFIRDVSQSTSVSQTSFKFSSNEFGNLVRNRPTRILDVLSIGYQHVLYMDLDIALLRDPFPYILNQSLGYFDVGGQSDGTRGNNPIKTYLCTGFLLFHNTTSSISLLREWERHMISGRLIDNNDQESFFVVMYTGKTVYSYAKFQSSLFANGVSINRQETLDNLQKGLLYMFHVNFSEGSATKIEHMKKIRLWRENPYHQGKNQMYNIIK